MRPRLPSAVSPWPTGSPEPNPAARGRDRDAANALYDRAAEMLLAARGIGPILGRDGASEAFAATLGCLEEVLAALAEAVADLGAAALGELAGATTAQEFDLALARVAQLRSALAAASQASGAAGEFLGPRLAGPRRAGK